MNYRALYGENADENEVRERYRSVAEGFRALKGEPPESFYSSSGRAEIIGNHTDHLRHCRRGKKEKRRRGGDRFQGL